MVYSVTTALYSTTCKFTDTTYSYTLLFYRFRSDISRLAVVRATTPRILRKYVYGTFCIQNFASSIVDRRRVPIVVILLVDTLSSPFTLTLALLRCLCVDHSVASSYRENFWAGISCSLRCRVVPLKCWLAVFSLKRVATTRSGLIIRVLRLTCSIYPYVVCTDCTRTRTCVLIHKSAAIFLASRARIPKGGECVVVFNAMFEGCYFRICTSS